LTHLLLTVGRPKAAYIQQGLEEYLQRLRPYGGAALASVKAARAAKNTPPAQVLAAEGQNLLARLQDRDLVWALERQGRAWSSAQWARRLDRARQSGRPRLVLVIGGALGLDRAVQQRAEALVSLGPATLAHELAALVAAEQLYRACTILAGTPYHRV